MQRISWIKLRLKYASSPFFHLCDPNIRMTFTGQPNSHLYSTFQNVATLVRYVTGRDRHVKFERAARTTIMNARGSFEHLLINNI